jgi:DNA-directed RNA polymerase subunit RPC12/RpoP
MSKEFQLSVISNAVAGNVTRVAAAEMATVFSESNHKPDIYLYKIKGGRLWSPVYKMYLDQLQTGIADRIIIQQMRSWAINNSEGMAVWVSPPNNKDLECKITTSTILKEKFVNNVGRNVDLSDKQILEVANLLIAYSINPLDEVKNLQEVSEKLIVVKDKQEVANIIERVTSQNEDWGEYKITLGRAAQMARNYKKSGSSIKLQEGIRANMGDHRLSCPTKPCHSVDRYGSREVSCPACGAINTRPFNQLLSRCQYCGSDKIACKH